MFEANIGILIGFGLVFVTLIILGVVARFIIGMAIPVSERKKTVLIIWRSLFGSILCVVLMVFMIVFSWTGVNVALTGEQPEGTLDPSGVLKLETTTGENRPEDGPARMKEGTELQKEGQKELDKFRKDFFESKQQEKPK